MKKLLTGYLTLSLIALWTLVPSGAKEAKQINELNCQKDCTNQRKIDCSDLKECEKNCKKEQSEAIQSYLVKAKELCDYFTKNKSTPSEGNR